jgi:hypothetical protein
MSHLIKLADELNMCRSKISFISDFFSLQSPVEFSDYSQYGLSFILDDVMISLSRVIEKIEAIPKETSTDEEVSE